MQNQNIEKILDFIMTLDLDELEKELESEKRRELEVSVFDDLDYLGS